MRRVKIYFDSNDEFVREDRLPEMLGNESARSHRSTDPDMQTNMGVEDIDEQQKLQDLIAFKYRYVEVFFGNEEQQLSGTTRITRNIFAGTNDRNENAMLFLDNLNKIKQTKSKAVADRQAQLLRKLNRDHNSGVDGLSQASYPTQLEGIDEEGRSDHLEGRFNSETDFDGSLDPVYEHNESAEGDEILLDLNHKADKPKDQLYLGFFAKYTELFVNE